jgi:hypothetical protein
VLAYAMRADGNVRCPFDLNGDVSASKYRLNPLKPFQQGCHAKMSPENAVQRPLWVICRRSLPVEARSARPFEADVGEPINDVGFGPTTEVLRLVR